MVSIESWHLEDRVALRGSIHQLSRSWGCKEFVIPIVGVISHYFQTEATLLESCN
jgi:hypothetical protein